MTIIYGALATLIAALVLAVGVEYIQVKDRDATIAKMQAADAKATSEFEAAARLKESEYAEQIHNAQMDFQTAQMLTAKRISDLSTRNGVLNGAIDAFARRDSCSMPAAAGAVPRADGPAAALGGLLERCLAVAGTSANDAESLAGQVRGLQAYIGATK